jgi:threonine/homoserine/homoserine lactone efflux protein
MLEELNWGAFILAMLVVELTPGPNMGWLTALSAQYGRAAGHRAVVGVTLGLGLQLVAAATGLSALLAGRPGLGAAIHWAGVAFMLYLAWSSWHESGESSPWRSRGVNGFRRGVIANLLNPKAFVFYLAVVGQFADPARGPVYLQILLLGLIHLSIAVMVHLTLVEFGTRLGQLLEEVRRTLVVRLGFALSMVAIAVWLAWSAAPVR